MNTWNNANVLYSLLLIVIVNIFMPYIGKNIKKSFEKLKNLESASKIVKFFRFYLKLSKNTLFLSNFWEKFFLKSNKRP